MSTGYADQPLTEIREGELYFCPELRKVCVGNTEIELTVKEFDALNLLISNRNRILTFESYLPLVAALVVSEYGLPDKG